MKEHYNLVGSKTCEEVLTKYPDYKVFWRSGYEYRGASESYDDKLPKTEHIHQCGTKETTFEDRMQRRYNWAAAIDIDVDHDSKEIHFNGFSSNDLY